MMIKMIIMMILMEMNFVKKIMIKNEDTTDNDFFKGVNKAEDDDINGIRFMMIKMIIMTILMEMNFIKKIMIKNEDTLTMIFSKELIMLKIII